jgi:Uri superfamily endonuclease
VRIRVGSLGTFTFAPGFYLYIGSARGPGGLRARIERHLRKDKVKRWHIDYLTASSSFRLVGAFMGMSVERMEGTLVVELMRAGIDECLAGFGSTDDPRVTSHLLAVATSLEECRRVVQRSFSRLFPLRFAFLALDQ